MLQNDHIRIYWGRSMEGTFHTGDRLILEPVSINELKKGDVIVFKRLDFGDTKKDLVHRVITISEKGVITKGDNNLYKDTMLVTSNNLVGRVTHIERGENQLKVQNGLSGLRRARFLHLRLPIKKIIWGICRVPYRSLKKSGLVSKIWRPDIKKIHIKTAEGDSIKYIHRKRTVAQIWPELGCSRCKKPYDLVIKI